MLTEKALEIDLKTTRISELTAEEFLILIRSALQQVLTKSSPPSPTVPRPPLNLPVLHLSPWPSSFKTLNREELYENDDR